jgi:hypothetical protein
MRATVALILSVNAALLAACGGGGDGTQGGSATDGPSISQVSGAFLHKGTVQISGSGFGTKSQAAPVVWDDASGKSVLDLWDVAWPSAGAAYDIAYRPAQRSIDLPHSNISRYLAGAHGGTTASGGANVMVWKNRTISSYPAYTYASWYQRADDAWSFGGDDNYKCFDFSRGTGGYDLPQNWYIEYNPPPTSTTSNATWHILDDAFGQSNASLDGPTSSWWQDSAVNPMGGTWSKIEVEIKYTDQPDGYIKLWENGVQRVSYSGHTDRYSTNQRSEGIGGYARQQNQPNNWRYFADIYLDYSLARVVLANNANLSQATIIEPQIPSAWTPGAITVTVNLGRFASGQTAYLFVFDPTGVRNATGFPITVDATGSAVPAPTLRLQK